MSNCGRAFPPTAGHSTVISGISFCGRAFHCYFGHSHVDFVHLLIDFVHLLSDFVHSVTEIVHLNFRRGVFSCQYPFATPLLQPVTKENDSFFIKTLIRIAFLIEKHQKIVAALPNYPDGYTEKIPQAPRSDDE